MENEYTLHRLNIRLRPELVNQLKTAAAAHQRSLNKEITWALENYMKELTHEHDASPASETEPEF